MEQVIEIMEKMWSKAKIVHADFSEFNILYFQKRVWELWLKNILFLNSNEYVSAYHRSEIQLSFKIFS